jgi:hypothetical protein
MLIHTLKKALMPGFVSLTRPRIALISSLVCTVIQVRSVNRRNLACNLPGLAHYAAFRVFLAADFPRGCLRSGSSPG